MIQIQTSIGYGSMGLAFKSADESDLPSLIAKTAQQMGYSVETVNQKLAAGGTLWLDRSDGRKIRGFDVGAAARLITQRDAERKQRMASDGYSVD